MAILASASFIDIERNRLCGAGLMIGDAESVFDVSYGSELRKARLVAEEGVGGAICEWRKDERDV